MHITRGGPRNQGELALTTGRGRGLRLAVLTAQPVSGAEGTVCGLFSVPSDPPMHITLVSLLFHVIFFNPKKYFLKVKKKKTYQTCKYLNPAGQ